MAVFLGNILVITKSWIVNFANLYYFLRYFSKGPPKFWLDKWVETIAFDDFFNRLEVQTLSVIDMAKIYPHMRGERVLVAGQQNSHHHLFSEKKNYVHSLITNLTKSNFLQWFFFLEKISVLTIGILATLLLWIWCREQWERWMFDENLKKE